MTQARDFPYIYITWLSALLSGDRSCEWAVWFRTHFEKYNKVPRDFNSARWNQEHTALLNRKRTELESEHVTVYTEAQNKFSLQGGVATLGGKADLVGIPEPEFFPDYVSGTVYDAKTGKPKDSDITQVQIYMWALPKAIERYRGMTLNGCLVYSDHEEDIPASSITHAFVERLVSLIKRVATVAPAIKIPAAGECQWCDITTADCPERVEGAQRTAVTNDF